MNKRAP